MATRRRSIARFTHVDRVEVHLWDRLAGVVALDPTYGYYAFRFTPEFRATGIDPSPLHMPVREDRAFIFADLPELTYRRLPAMLSDSLPDDFGNALIDRYMADRGVSAREVTSLDRLAYMSDRAMGALQFRPARGPATQKATPVELAELVSQARKAVIGSVAHDDDTSAALRSIIEVGTSAGGARAKAVIAWNRSTNEIRTGQLAAPHGFEHWLLKFDGMGDDRELGTTGHYGRVEYAYHLMALEAGIDMTECRLLEENGRAHFMTRRFDRDQAQVRHHVQTLCAMAHLDYKKKGTNAYSQLFTTLRELNLPYRDREEAFRRMVFNAMGRNCDDHTKNFAFRLRQGQSWELAPAYDVTFAHNPKGEWTHQHLMSINGKFKDFTEQDLLLEAGRFAIGTAPAVIDQVRAALRRWATFAERAGLPEAEARRIADELLPLRRRRADKRT
ncbi:MAG: type II toxin-antitoxin system HipA family toxin [Gammaproteobacteria bacterium]